MTDELAFELASLDVPDGPPVDADWQRCCADCGIPFVPRTPRTIRCVPCQVWDDAA